MKPFCFFLLGTILIMSEVADAQPKGFNYDESKVPKFELPDPLKFEDGRVVKTAAEWPARRKELLGLFETEVYGKSPARPKEISGKITDIDLIHGGAVKQIQLEVKLTEDGPAISVLIFRPAKVKGPLPAFLGYNFHGNHTVDANEKIRIPTSWVRNDKNKGATNNQAAEKGRGTSASRWPVDLITKNQFVLMTVYYGDVDPDFHDQFQNGIHAKINVSETRRPDHWGSIAAWGWSLSRVLDYLESAADEKIGVDPKKVFVIGHSRLGKTSLWASAADVRFAGAISNNSGCGGAALSKRAFGETVKRINTSFPHWFCDRFKKYNDNEAALPIDQHQLIALTAPRPVYIASATGDQWADPRGEFLAAVYASPVYELLGKKGLAIDAMPPANTPSIGTVSYHLREGRHDITSFDWTQYIKFAEQALN